MITKGYADTAVGQIHFRRVEGGGAPVILLHRTPVASESFERMLQRLEGTRAAIAFDTPGFGQSFSPLGYPSTADYATWFLAAIDALGVEEFHVCAHHTGTHFAVEMAVLAVDRVRSVLLNGVLYAARDERIALRAAIGGGVQHAVELGGQGTIAQTLSSMAIGGHIALIGALAGFGGDIPGATLVSSALRVSAIAVGSHAGHLEMTQFLAESRIKPVIDSAFDLESVEEAYARASRGAFGKVVIRL